MTATSTAAATWTVPSDSPAWGPGPAIRRAGRQLVVHFERAGDAPNGAAEAQQAIADRLGEKLQDAEVVTKCRQARQEHKALAERLAAMEKRQKELQQQRAQIWDVANENAGPEFLAARDELNRLPADIERAEQALKAAEITDANLLLNAQSLAMRETIRAAADVQLHLAAERSELLGRLASQAGPLLEQLAVIESKLSVINNRHHHAGAVNKLLSR